MIPCSVLCITMATNVVYCTYFLVFRFNKRYPQFEGAAAIQNQLNTDAAKASAVLCGKMNRATLEQSGLVSKQWPIR